MKFNVDFGHHDNKKRKDRKDDILKMLEEESILAKFKSPFNAYILLIAAAIYNVANITIINGTYDMTHVMMLFAREMAAASIGVYGLARLYYIFIDSVFKRLLWYFLIITAAFNFGTFVEIATQWVHTSLAKLIE